MFLGAAYGTEMFSTFEVRISASGPRWTPAYDLFHPALRRHIITF
jgi:hypothetical protein